MIICWPICAIWVGVAGLTLVANGDINQSGDFNADFVVSLDIV
jgi:hypothetical protein